MRYRKETKKRKISKLRVLVLCEGKTEKIYLQGLRNTLPKQLQRDIQLDFVTAKEAEPAKAIHELDTKVKKAKGEKQPYKEFWLVFDDDNRNLNGVFQQLSQMDARYVYSSIAIEFWFLLHYRDTRRRFASANEAIAEIEGIEGSYSKTDNKRWDKLAEHYERAKARTIAIRAQHNNDEIVLPACKPYSNMDELVDRIKELEENYNVK
ncbi:MAG TPA: RloB family protein [Bacteroidales bacterium]|nr:RloB family protein [Bacteroidales bacterium]HRX98176.1 RloB family protein [Bacteroidales bacterium]